VSPPVSLSRRRLACLIACKTPIYSVCDVPAKAAAQRMMPAA